MIGAVIGGAVVGVVNVNRSTAPIDLPPAGPVPAPVRHGPVVLNTVTRTVTNTAPVRDDTLVAVLRQETVDLRQLLARRMMGGRRRSSADPEVGK